MDKKISNAIYALYGGAIANAITAIITFIQFQQFRTGIELDQTLSPTFAMSFATFPLMILVATYFVSQELKAKKKWSWILALTVFIVNFSGFAILFSIYGAIQLCDREVREYFFKQMEISLD